MAQGYPQEREVTRDTEDGQESSSTARWHPPSGGPVSRCPPAGSTALRSQEPHPCSGVGHVQSHRPGLKVDSRWGGWPGLFCSQGWYGRRGAHPVVWKSHRTEKAAEPPRCGSRWEMLSAPTQGEYSTEGNCSLSGSCTFSIKQWLSTPAPNTHTNSQAVCLGVLPAVRQPSLRFCREGLAPKPCVSTLCSQAA